MGKKFTYWNCIFWTVCFMSTSAVAKEAAFGATIKNKYLINAGSTCAGWRFIGTSKVERYDEMYCSRGEGKTYSARVQWLNDKQFAIVQTSDDLLGGTTENRTPRVEIYELAGAEGSKIYLKSYWTGWGNNKSEVEEYRLVR